MSAKKPVVTRFAPSPTGFLHIGGGRTALFNWLYAKHTGGKFLLRIEDTDRERSTPEATEAILDGLNWLGLKWDGDAVFQAVRADRHAAVARELLAKGQAYHCYLSTAELDQMRKEAEANKQPFLIRSPWRDKGPADAPKDGKPVIRLKTPREGETVIDDHVQGRVVIQNKDLDDLIILRSDGTPIYNLAVVVDDHDMGVTHVVRGVDHLTNAAKQTLIYKAMGWDVPDFAHVPLIHGADGAKLSKRHGALGVEAYRAMGYLPAALRNYLVRLGWSHGNDEIFSTEQMIEWFGIDGLGKSPARFDFVKLADLNGHYIRQAADADLIKETRAMLPHLDFVALSKVTLDPKEPVRPDVTLAKSVLTQRPDLKTGVALEAALGAAGWDRVTAALPGIKERSKTLCEIVDQSLYLVAKLPLAMDDKAKKVMDTDAKTALGVVLPVIDGASDWSAGALEAAVKAHAEATGAKLGKIAQPLRVALTGRTVSPPVFDVLATLGKAEAVARIKAVL
jgi:glutamyl-tRNA synthetase